MAEALIQTASILTAAILLWWNRLGIVKFLPAALFASLYANFFCYIAKAFDWWEFPVRFFPAVEDISATCNLIVLPAAVMVWLKHIPHSPGKRILWALYWSIGMTLAEFLCERFTGLIRYRNGYEWYFSLLLWFFSWFVWYAFHIWMSRRLKALL